MSRSHLIFGLVFSAFANVSCARDVLETRLATNPCQYEITYHSDLLNSSLPILVTHATTIAACQAACTEQPYCGNIGFRPPKNATDENCGYYQQFYYEKYPIQPAPASHAVLSVKKDSCGKSVAKRKPLKCTPGTTTFKGTKCKYNTTCGRVLPQYATLHHHQSSIYGPQPDLQLCFEYGNKNSVPYTRIPEAFSFTEGGHCIVIGSAYYQRRSTERYKRGVEYQIIKDSCEAEQATPSRANEELGKDEGRAWTFLAT